MHKYNHAILALNHYITVGDCLGEGNIAVEGGEIKFVIPVNTSLPVDIADWNKLKSKLSEMAYPKFILEDLGTDRYDSDDPWFRMFTLTIKDEDCDAFIQCLCEKPGKLGWGSPKVFLDLIDWEKCLGWNYYAKDKTASAEPLTLKTVQSGQKDGI